MLLHKSFSSYCVESYQTSVRTASFHRALNIRLCRPSPKLHKLNCLPTLCVCACQKCAVLHLWPHLPVMSQSPRVHLYFAAASETFNQQKSVKTRLSGVICNSLKVVLNYIILEVILIFSLSIDVHGGGKLLEAPLNALNAVQPNTAKLRIIKLTSL